MRFQNEAFWKGDAVQICSTWNAHNGCGWYKTDQCSFVIYNTISSHNAFFAIQKVLRSFAPLRKCVGWNTNDILVINQQNVNLC